MGDPRLTLSVMPLQILSKISGTAVMHVGFKTLASPLDPFIIFVLVSIKVFADEYPIGTPVRRQTLSANNSKTWASGRKPSNTSSG